MIDAFDRDLEMFYLNESECCFFDLRERLWVCLPNNETHFSFKWRISFYKSGLAKQVEISLVSRGRKEP